LYINGTEHRVRGADAFLPLTDYLRYNMSACGTKVVCAEGDCGACTVAIGKLAAGGKLDYVPVNGCIQYVYQLDCSHIITVEGVGNSEELNPVQKAMVDCHGAQCGYCTPGFIVAMCSMFDSGEKIERADVKEGLSGNLCRCTGYVSIIDAALAVDAKKFVRFAEQYPDAAMCKAFKEHSQQPPLIEAEGRSVFCPLDLPSAVEFKMKHPDAVIVSGGTDVSVNMNKRGYEPENLLSTGNLPGMDQIENDGTTLIVGARVQLRQLEHYVKELIPELYKVLFVFGSPQIRYAGTLAGNIANASPIADTGPFLFVMDAMIEVASTAGSRQIKINDLYQGYKKLAMKPEEIITKIHIPLPRKDDLLKLYKVSRREHLDISSFTAAIRMRRDSDSIVAPVVSYGGVGPVVLRLPKTEEFLRGKPFTLETFKSAGVIARSEITPLSDVRGSSDFRYQLAENVLLKFYYETAAERQLVCR
jgi:xanthine dehydrogenase small subunit